MLETIDATMTMDQAKKTHKENKEKMQRKWLFESLCLWGILLFIIVFIGGIVPFFILKYNFMFSFSIIIIVMLMIGVIQHRSVPHKHEWTIEFFGKWVTTWEPGLHFLFPVGMKISGKVYMGDNLTTLYMDDKERDGEIDALIEFKDTSASVIVRLYYQIISSHSAVYEIDNVARATREKMDSGIRAFFGKINLDKAIQIRTSVNLDTIIKEDATEAHLFKCWGVEIKSIALTDIGLPEEVKKQRNRVLEAEKDFETAKIYVKTARQEAKAKIVKLTADGKAAAQEIEEIIEKTELSKEAVAEYLLNKVYFESIKDNKGVVIGSQGTSAPLMGAKLGAGLSLVGDLTKKPIIDA